MASTWSQKKKSRELWKVVEKNCEVLHTNLGVSRGVCGTKATSSLKGKSVTIHNYESRKDVE